MVIEELKDRIVSIFEDMKAIDVNALDVREMTSITDYMIIASGSSSRHVKSIADRVVEDLRDLGVKPIGIEGEQPGDWILLDYGDVVMHVMHPQAREFYDLEKLWSTEVHEMIRAHREAHPE